MLLPAGFPSWARWHDLADKRGGRSGWRNGPAATRAEPRNWSRAERERGCDSDRLFMAFGAETRSSRPGLPALQERSSRWLDLGMNLAPAGRYAGLRFGLATEGPIDVLLLSLVLGNAAMAVMSLVPVSGSDGRRALSAFYRSARSVSRGSSCQSGPGSGRSGSTNPTATSRSSPNRVNGRSHRQVAQPEAEPQGW